MNDDSGRNMPARPPGRLLSRPGRRGPGAPDLRVLPGVPGRGEDPAPRPTPGRGAGSARAIEPTTGASRPLRLLVVHPDGAARRALVEAMGPAVELVGEATDGPQALPSLLRLRPDVLLTAPELPCMSGLELLRVAQGGHPEVYPMLVAAEEDEQDAGSLRRAMAAGAREFLRVPPDAEELEPALARARRHRQAWEAVAAERRCEPGAGIWCFAGPGTGAGRTTLLLSLAHELAARGRRVAVVDLDLYFGDVAFYLGLDRTGPGFAELVEAPGMLEQEVLEAHLRDSGAGFRVLTGPPDVFRASTLNRERCVLATLALTRVVDDVLVDLPPGLEDGMMPIMDEARVVLSAADGSIASLKNAKTMAALMGELGYPPEKFHLILTRLDPSARAGKEFDTILSRVGSGLSAVLPADAENLERAVLAGVPVPELAPESSYTAAVRRLADRVVGRQAGEEAAAPARPGILRRLLG